MSENKIERALDWGDIISEESSFQLLEAGDYEFTVIKLARGRHEGSEKLPPCAKAILTIGIIKDGQKVTEIEHNLFLHTKVEGLLSAFFLAVGLKKHGEPFQMNWQAVQGAKGKCHIYIDEFKKKDGSDGKSNKIKYFIDPAKESSAAPSSVPATTYAPPAAGGWGNGSGWGK